MALGGALVAFLGCHGLGAPVLPLELSIGLAATGIVVASLMVMCWRYRGSWLGIVSAAFISLTSLVVSHYFMEPLRSMPMGVYVQCMGVLGLGMCTSLWMMRADVPQYCRFERARTTVQE